ncbi:hypothetical protein RV09_GL002804 [Enterococcus moraviensis]|nr:hypothetical protein RV09_GL002804 [Enterococcus moraviensis]
MTKWIKPAFFQLFTAVISAVNSYFSLYKTGSSTVFHVLSKNMKQGDAY